VEELRENMYGNSELEVGGGRRAMDMKKIASLMNTLTTGLLKSLKLMPSLMLLLLHSVSCFA
jgi:hypothetical protein